MPPSMQAKLVRALEARTVRPVGSDTEVPFRARVVATTNKTSAAQILGFDRRTMYRKLERFQD